MSTADRPAEPAAVASDVAAACRDAAFVRLVAAADGDALAATGVLARALDATGRPFQASVVPAPDPVATATEADVTVTVGRPDTATDHGLSTAGRPHSETAAAVARELGVDPNPVLALAGATVGRGEPSGDLLQAATAAGVSRRPGVAVPTADVADGLAHSTLVHAPFSGDVDAARTALAEADLGAVEDVAAMSEDDHRRLASLAAIETAAADGATPRAAEVVERFLRPHAGGPFGTVEGYGDVLDAVAREQPGTGIALALGHAAREAALEAWRRHGRRVHATLRSATTGRYDGLFVARGDPADLSGTAGSDGESLPVASVARTVADYRSPEPVTLFVTDGRAAAVATDDRDLRPTMDAAVAETGGRAGGGAHAVRTTVETDTAAFITAFREAL